MNARDPLSIIFARNAFYQRLHFLVLGALALSIIVNGFLVWALYFLIKNPFQPLYFATDSVGRLIQLVPVDQPNMKVEEVAAIAVEAVQAAYSYDYVNYRDQLQRAQRYFTTYGWSSYMKALTESNNLVAMTNRKQIVIAQVVGAPELVVQRILAGAYAWKFKMPVLITYWEPPYDNKSKVVNALEVSIVLQRQPILQSYKGVGVVQLIATFATAAPAQPGQISSSPTG
ncbi:MAG: hypothetical protein EPO11_06990 [Gammaproteobacteria bacterium]|nr:MAG: hypothetical protein EPO11_06990 [Gammaproteobacteria bacterium]